MSRGILSFCVIKDVSTGEVVTVRNGMVGVSALESGVAVNAWDRPTRLSGIAHVMPSGGGNGLERKSETLCDANGLPLSRGFGVRNDEEG